MPSRGRSRAPCASAALLVTAAFLAPAAPSQAQTALETYLSQGVETNLDLELQRLVARQSFEDWQAARSSFLPSVELGARYSMAEGGRTFLIPAGDLVNPAYDALNGILGTPDDPTPFPQVPNQRLNLLFDRDQETRFRVTQILWNGALRSDVRARRSAAAAQEAGVEVLTRQLVRDIRVAYYRYANAERSVRILSDALATVQENERAQTALVAEQLETRDRVHRARAERLEVVQELERARAGRDAAEDLFNYLLDRDPGSPVEVDPRDFTLEGRPAWDWVRGAADDGTDGWLRTASAQAMNTRPELERMDRGIEAADAAVGAQRGSLRPNVVLSVDAGITNRDYGIGDEDRYVLASLVLNWKLTPWGPESARVRRATLERERLTARRRQVARGIELEVDAAVRDARVALAGLASAREREVEARDAFRFVSRRRSEGLATPLEFLDARAALTRASLGLAMTETEALISLAELEFAAGPELPRSPRITDTENDR